MSADDDRRRDPLAALDRLIALHVDPALHGHLGDDDDNAAEYVRRGIRALQDEVTTYRREHYDDHMHGHRMDRSDVRCLDCNLRYAEAAEYGCEYGHKGELPAGFVMHGAGHCYVADDLAAAMTCDDPIHQYANQFEEG